MCQVVCPVDNYIKVKKGICQEFVLDRYIGNTL